MNKIDAPIIDMKLTGERISSLRKRNGLSIKQLQEYMGLATPQAIYKWEHGLNLPSIDNLLFLSRIFNIPIDSIIICQNDVIVDLEILIQSILANEESQNKSSFSTSNHHNRFKQGEYSKDMIDGMDKKH